MNKHRIFKELKENPKNIRYEKLCKAAEAFGFNLKGQKGSHRTYVKDGVKEILNFQKVGSKAKPYQVRQFIKIIEQYDFITEDDTDA